MILWIILTIPSALLLFSAILYSYTHPQSSSSFHSNDYLRLHIIGDFGELDPKWNFTVLPLVQVAEAMTARASSSPISMVITTGDNFYELQTSGLFHLVKYLYTDLYNGESIRSVPWYLSYGNHDYYYSKYLGKMIESLYPNIHMPAAPWNLTINLPSFKADFSFLPSDLVCHEDMKSTITKKHCLRMYAYSNYNSTISWLDQHLSEANKDPLVLWKFVVIHYPFFSVSTAGFDSEALKFHILPILRKHSVDMIFSGHNHNMQYLVSHNSNQTNYVKQEERQDCASESKINCNEGLIRCYLANVTCRDRNISCKDIYNIEQHFGSPYDRLKNYNKGEFLHQVVQGAGGSDLNPICPNFSSPMAEHVFSLSHHGFSELTLTNSSLVVRYILSNGTTVFESSIVNNKGL